MNTDDAKALAERGLAELNDALQQGRSETLVDYLKVLARFHKYSFQNAMMIAMQKPEASFVAGYRKWPEFGRHVRKGERGIAIFAPMTYRRKKTSEDDGEEVTVTWLAGFKVVHVFDISQTDGEDLPQFGRASGDPGQMFEQLEQLVARHGIELEYKPLPSGTDGMSCGGRIVVREGLSAAEQFAVLVHELAHELLHKSERRHETTKQIRETEAEAVAFVVCQACDVETKTRSADYIQLHRGDADVLAESLAFIQKTAATMIEALVNQPAAAA